MVPISRYIVFVAIAGMGVGVDLWTKHWMFRWLGMPRWGSPDDVWWLWPNIFGFQTTLNEGALFGMGQGMWMIFAALAAVAAVGILAWLFIFGAAREWWLTVTLALVMAGILGNFYDRLGLPGLQWRAGEFGHHAGETVHAVRDFVLMQYGGFRWWNYNIADSMLVCGAIMLVIHAFFFQQAPQGDGLAETPAEPVSKNAATGKDPS